MTARETPRPKPKPVTPTTRLFQKSTAAWYAEWKAKARPATAAAPAENPPTGLNAAAAR